MDLQRIAPPIPGAVPVQSQLTSRDGVYELTLYYPSPTPLEIHDILHGPVTWTVSSYIDMGSSPEAIPPSDSTRFLVVQLGAQPPVSVIVSADKFYARPANQPPLVICLVDSDTRQVVGERWRTGWRTA